MHAIRQRITGRTLGPGARLPSIRSFASSMAVSKSTIVEAYHRLAAEGTIISRRGSGFYVAGHGPSLPSKDIETPLDHLVDPFWISHLSLNTGDDVLKPGCGWLPSSWMPEVALRRALRTIARADDSQLMDFAPPLGLKTLRQVLSRRIIECGIHAVYRSCVSMCLNVQTREFSLSLLWLLNSKPRKQP
ncbi:GntR family transcriptional regulator (plasmid) [Phyllobacterium sp. 628]|nr:GntR family transcriptional regulator [Phyllobacterium sp. 628]